MTSTAQESRLLTDGTPAVLYICAARSQQAPAWRRNARSRRAATSPVGTACGSRQ
ncbi:hypothetical protein [Streptomyces sp. NBRC 110611]|uniref:hypothetical protein n=1 Tax=Streptomyces sp. NBRC 110611 TaxID=1621259 RepID=UPI000B0411AD|nr:hypothetical protein [Streptomyces sp. NBRC 110611]